MIQRQKEMKAFNTQPAILARTTKYLNHESSVCLLRMFVVVTQRVFVFYRLLPVNGIEESYRTVSVL